MTWCCAIAPQVEGQPRMLQICQSEMLCVYICDKAVVIPNILDYNWAHCGQDNRSVYGPYRVWVQG
jgi:hypothetical protein